MNKFPVPPLKRSLPPVDVDEMTFAFQLFQGGMRQVLPTRNPEERGIEMGNPFVAQQLHGSLPEPLQNMFVVRGTKMAPKDTKLHRGLEALKAHYQNHPQGDAIAFRMVAFYFLFNDVGLEAFGHWWKSDPSDSEAALIHPAVMDAIATAPTNKYGQFSKTGFFKLVSKVAKKKYPDEE